jgi:hypothetical protein
MPRHTTMVDEHPGRLGEDRRVSLVTIGASISVRDEAR